MATVEKVNFAELIDQYKRRVSQTLLYAVPPPPRCRCRSSVVASPGTYACGRRTPSAATLGLGTVRLWPRDVSPYSHVVATNLPAPRCCFLE